MTHEQTKARLMSLQSHIERLKARVDQIADEDSDEGLRARVKLLEVHNCFLQMVINEILDRLNTVGLSTKAIMSVIEEVIK